MNTADIVKVLRDHPEKINDFFGKIHANYYKSVLEAFAFNERLPLLEILEPVKIATLFETLPISAKANYFSKLSLDKAVSLIPYLPADLTGNLLKKLPKTTFDSVLGKLDDQTLMRILSNFSEDIKVEAINFVSDKHKPLALATLNMKELAAAFKNLDIDMISRSAENQPVKIKRVVIAKLSSDNISKFIGRWSVEKTIEILKILPDEKMLKVLSGFEPDKIIELLNSSWGNARKSFIFCNMDMDKAARLLTKSFSIKDHVYYYSKFDEKRKNDYLKKLSQEDQKLLMQEISLHSSMNVLKNLDDNVSQKILENVDSKEREELVNRMQIISIAKVFEKMDVAAIRKIIQKWPSSKIGTVISRLNSEKQISLIMSLSKDKIIDLIPNLATYWNPKQQRLIFHQLDSDTTITIMNKIPLDKRIKILNNFAVDFLHDLFKAADISLSWQKTFWELKPEICIKLLGILLVDRIVPLIKMADTFKRKFVFENLDKVKSKEILQFVAERERVEIFNIISPQAGLALLNQYDSAQKLAILSRMKNLKASQVLILMGVKEIKKVLDYWDITKRIDILHLINNKVVSEIFDLYEDEEIKKIVNGFKAPKLARVLDCYPENQIDKYISFLDNKKIYNTLVKMTWDKGLYVLNSLTPEKLKDFYELTEPKSLSGFLDKAKDYNIAYSIITDNYGYSGQALILKNMKKENFFGVINLYSHEDKEELLKKFDLMALSRIVEAASAEEINYLIKILEIKFVVSAIEKIKDDEKCHAKIMMIDEKIRETAIKEMSKKKLAEVITVQRDPKMYLDVVLREFKMEEILFLEQFLHIKTKLALLRMFDNKLKIQFFNGLGPQTISRIFLNITPEAQIFFFNYSSAEKMANFLAYSEKKYDDILEQLKADSLVKIINNLSGEALIHYLTTIKPEIISNLIKKLSYDKVRQVIYSFQPDYAARYLETLDKKAQLYLLQKLDKEKALALLEHMDAKEELMAALKF